MGWNQKIEYVEVTAVPAAPVKKQVWDGEKFVSMTLHKIPHAPKDEHRNWLWRTYGPAGVYIKGRYWDYSQAGNFTVMDEKLYTWYQMKWGNK